MDLNHLMFRGIICALLCQLALVSASDKSTQVSSYELMRAIVGKDLLSKASILSMETQLKPKIHISNNLLMVDASLVENAKSSDSVDISLLKDLPSSLVALHINEVPNTDKFTSYLYVQTDETNPRCAKVEVKPKTLSPSNLLQISAENFPVLGNASSGGLKYGMPSVVVMQLPDSESSKSVRFWGFTGFAMPFDLVFDTPMPQNWTENATVVDLVPCDGSSTKDENVSGSTKYQIGVIGEMKKAGQMLRSSTSDIGLLRMSTQIDSEILKSFPNIADNGLIERMSTVSTLLPNTAATLGLTGNDDNTLLILKQIKVYEKVNKQVPSSSALEQLIKPFSETFNNVASSNSILRLPYGMLSSFAGPQAATTPQTTDAVVTSESITLEVPSSSTTTTTVSTTFTVLATTSETLSSTTSEAVASDLSTVARDLSQDQSTHSVAASTTESQTNASVIDYAADTLASLPQNIIQRSIQSLLSINRLQPQKAEEPAVAPSTAAQSEHSTEQPLLKTESDGDTKIQSLPISISTSSGPIINAAINRVAANAVNTFTRSAASMAANIVPPASTLNPAPRSLAKASGDDIIAPFEASLSPINQLINEISRETSNVVDAVSTNLGSAK